MKKIIIGSDHAGYELKEYLKIHLRGFEFVDVGPFSNQSVDYPDYANLVAQKVSTLKSEDGFGILVCGSGEGMVIRANRYPQIRAALVWNKELAQLTREHNDANIICLGSRFHSSEEALGFVKIFAETKFSEGRHSPRVAKLGIPL